MISLLIELRGLSVGNVTGRKKKSNENGGKQRKRALKTIAEIKSKLIADKRIKLTILSFVG